MNWDAGFGGICRAKYHQTAAPHRGYGVSPLKQCGVNN